MMTMMKAIIFDWGRTLYENENQQVFPEAAEVLEHLSKKYILALVSLIPEGTVEVRKEVINRSGLAKHFASIALTLDNKDAMYEMTLKRLALKPEEVVIVDDRVIRGIKWGNRNGAKTVWLKKGKFSAELPNSDTGEPTHTIENLSQLRALF